MDEPVLLPAKKDSQKCAEPNFDYLCDKHPEFGVSAVSRMYDEYVSACEKVGIPPYSWSRFKEIERGQRKLKEQQQKKPGEFIYCEGMFLPKEHEYDDMGRHRNLFVAFSPYTEYSFACVYEGPKAKFMANELWIRYSAKAYRYFGGVHRATLCPNLMRRARLSESSTQAYTLNAFAAHYKTVCFYPRGEGGRRKHFFIHQDSSISRFISSRLKGFSRLSTEELNRLISKLMDEFNSGINSRGNVRREDFIAHELPNLLPLPADDYDMSEWCERSIGLDYHFTYKYVRYSVPYQYALETVLVRVSENAIEAYKGGMLIASHRLYDGVDGRKVITDPAHRLESHKAMANRLPSYFMRRARQIGPATTAVMKELCSVCKTNGGSFRACKDLLDLQSMPSELTLEEACGEVLRDEMDMTVHSVSSMMKHAETGA